MRRLTAFILLLCAGTILLAADNQTAGEDTKIEALLAKVARQVDVRFVRNGKDYDAVTATKFLRGKWGRQRAGIKTTQDFIDKVAAKSSTSGQPYLIRFKDGKTVACREFLAQLLTAP